MEYLRRFIRLFIHYDSFLYRLGSRSFDFFTVVRKEGFRTWRSLNLLGKSNQNSSAPVAITLSNLAHPVYIRPGTFDAKTVTDSIIREEYGQLDPSSSPLWMIDAGAYIGDTSAYFLSRFSGLKIIALEPNPPSFEMASRNLKPYGDRVTVLQRGVASLDKRFSFGGESTGVSLVGREGNGDENEIDCVTIPTLLKQYSIPKVDILKMDIEGAEEEIFRNNPESWLGCVDYLLIELHGSRIESFVLSVLEHNGFTSRQYRSVWYCKNGKE